ncbi:MAG: DUF456 family protein [Synechococcales cyanobacterium RU_4_20]|nr:DUF456 family protein [Synechococcales cyanobacterium RU_4_20]NJR71486.1 DUF456 family protein [Synechococcales cyanobacterium CRU_2_2]
MDFTVLYWVLVGVMALGVLGSVVPLIPGPSMILVAILIWCVATNFSIALGPLILIFVTLILSAGVEWLAGFWGARRAGASKWGQIGAVLGMTLGFLGLLPALPVGGPIFGILFGAVLGAFLGEFLHRRDLNFKERAALALNVSVAIAVGSLVGNLLEVVLAIAAVGIFLWSTWPPLGLGA